MNMLDFLLLILGGVMGSCAWLTYRRLPSAWLVEYGETVVPPELEPGQRTRSSSTCCSRSLPHCGQWSGNR